MKTAIITGASGDIGKAIAIAISDIGYNIVICYKENKKAAAALKAEIEEKGQRAICLKADITKENEVEELFKNAEKEFGFIDVLVNNAGISKVGLFTDMSLEEWNSVINTNLTGAFLCSKRALRGMISKKSGDIINISSMWGQTGASCEVAYSASKAGLIGLTKALAKEVGPSKIKVNCIAPGLIDTKMNSSFAEEEIKSICEETPLGKIGKPEDVAKAVVFLLENGFITGETISINGGFVI